MSKNPASKNRCRIRCTYLLLAIFFLFFIYIVFSSGDEERTFLGFLTLTNREKGAYKNVDNYGATIILYSPPIPSLLFSVNRFYQWHIHLHPRCSDSSLLDIKESISIINPHLLNLSHIGDKLTDNELQTIEGASRLDDLFIRNTAVTDASMPLLLSLPNARYIDITGSKITEEGIKQIIDHKFSQTHVMFNAMHLTLSEETSEKLKLKNPKVVVQTKWVRPSDAPSIGNAKEDIPTETD